jgi:hypothetical protein
MWEAKLSRFPDQACRIDWRKAMIRSVLSRQDIYLDSNDLGICQQAFDAILVELDIANKSEEAERAAAIIIQLYRQGIHDERQLFMLASADCGRIRRGTN